MGDINAAWRFAETAFNVRQEEIIREVSEKRKQVKARFASQGAFESGMRYAAEAQVIKDGVRDRVLAKADALLEGCERHQVVIDDTVQSKILDDVLQYQKKTIANVMQSLSSAGGGLGRGSSLVTAHLFETDVVSHNKLLLKIQQTRFPRRDENTPQPATNVYHIHGANPRVNVNSHDESVNVVTVTNTEVFAKIREEIETRVPIGDGQEEILSRLTALEEAQGSPGFAQRYADFISSAANHMTILSPFIPALTELLKKAL